MLTTFRIRADWVLGRWVVAVELPGEDQRVWLDAHKLIECHLAVAERQDDLSHVLAVVTAFVHNVNNLIETERI